MSLHRRQTESTKQLRDKHGRDPEGCKSLLSVGEDNLQFYPNFALFSTMGDEHFFQVSKSSEDQKKVFTKNGTLFSSNSDEDQKKRFSPKMEHFFSPEIQVETCAQVHNGVKFLEEMQMKTILKLLGWIQSIIGGYIPPSPPGFGTPGDHIRHRSQLHIR